MASYARNDKKVSILIIEDNPATALTLTDVFEGRGYTVKVADSASSAKDLIDSNNFNLITLDLMLPDADGLVLCADLKARTGLPIIIISGSNHVRDRVLGLKLGADDFIGKPFDIDELEARVDAVLRRCTYQPKEVEVSPDTAQTTIVIGNLKIDRGRRSVCLGDETLQLTPTEYRLLSALLQKPEEVMSREELAQQVWGYADASIGRAIDAHISRLRVKLSLQTVKAPYIISVKGLGYKISETEPKTKDK